jgi:hypothetical protein
MPRVGHTPALRLLARRSRKAARKRMSNYAANGIRRDTRMNDQSVGSISAPCAASCHEGIL